MQSPLEGWPSLHIEMPAYGGNSGRDASMLLRVLFQGVDPDQVREAVIDTIQRAMAKDPPPSLKGFNDVAPTLPQPPRSISQT
jgi:hypothetical protein